MIKKLYSRKKIFLIVAILFFLIISAIIITFMLNSTSNQWTVLFPEMTNDEKSEIYLVLDSLNVDKRMNEEGNIEVRSEDWDRTVSELTERGYLQTAPSYNTFFDNISITMSDDEKKETIRFELQNRIQTMLNRIDGVSSAIVNISLPESKNYVWNEDKGRATASVMLTLSSSDSFSPSQVDAIKNAISYSIQQMSPEDVKVINSATGLEMQGSDGTQVFQEEFLGKSYEKSAVKILSPVYGEKNITAVAAVNVEKDVVSLSSISVVIETESSVFSDEERENAVILLKNALGISSEKITIVGNTAFENDEQDNNIISFQEFYKSKWVMPVVSVILLIIFIFIICIFIIVYISRKKSASSRIQLKEITQALSSYKISEDRKTKIEDIKSFAKTNPEIAAELIRTMIKK